MIGMYDTDADAEESCGTELYILPEIWNSVASFFVSC